MTDQPYVSPAQIRIARAENPKMRARDLADKLDIREAQLVAAYVGIDVTRIDADPDAIMPLLKDLGDLMALTRNRSCVIEKVGFYDQYHSGRHASMILNDAIDLRIFARHWVTAFAVEQETKNGVRRSLQVFDAAGDAVHKIYLRENSMVELWAILVSDLANGDQNQMQDCTPRAPVAGPKADPAKAGALRADWAKMTDTHQFMGLIAKLKMNRLGAYRVVGAPWARALETDAIAEMLSAVFDQGTEVMVFVGNMGCIEIHGGPIKSLKPMGPWQNVLDAGFNLHLRADHVTEVWAVNKPTKRGMARSIEAFDAEGGLIFQVFGRNTEELDSRPAWAGIIDKLPTLHVTETA